MTQPDDTLISAFDGWVALQPGAIALSDGEREVSYGDLSAAIDVMASRLNYFLPSDGMPVVIRAQHKLDTISLALGAMRAGRPYALVDDGAAPSTVVAACRAIGQDCLVQLDPSPPSPDLAANLAAAGIDVVTLPDSASPVGPTTRSARIADYAFTSGTTGAPKILVNSHAYRLDIYRRWRLHYGVAANDTVAVQSGFMYDAMFEVFVALTAGARAVLLPDRGYLNGADWFERIRAGGVTRMMTMPSALVAAIETAPKPIMVPKLRQLIFTGEPVSARALAMAEQYLPGHVALHNCFGISEALMIADREVRGHDVIAANSFDFAKDALMPVQLTPVEGGERLDVSGPGVFDGYLSADGKVLPAVQPWPTSDLFMRREDGSHRYAGRMGRTVKVCGYLVSKDEIEGAMMRLPEVARARVETDDVTQEIRCWYDGDRDIDLKELIRGIALEF